MAGNTIRKIGIIHTDFPEKFGVPRQSGLVEDLAGRIVFEPEYRIKEAFRGLEGFSHIWIIWEFSEAGSRDEEDSEKWRPTVRPPVLGGNKRMGVFATRSPFRPNRIGLSSVRLEKIDYEDEEGPVLHVSGIDMVDGTPVLDIKPYLAYADSHPDAKEGFLSQASRSKMDVVIPDEVLEELRSYEVNETFQKLNRRELNRQEMNCQEMNCSEKMQALRRVLEQNPLPAYASDPERIYGMTFAGLEVRFSVSGSTLTVKSIEPAAE